MPMKPFSGSIAGYDLGGNSAHGLAIVKFAEGKCEELSIQTHRNTESALCTIESYGEISAIGIDTLAAWSTGDSGWRQADLWLRRTYKRIQSSIVLPNGLY